MRYVRAQDIFPAQLLELIQTYVDGEYVYIPRKAGEKRAWGESTRSKEEIHVRNQAIYEDYQNGSEIETLSRDYYLSDKSIRRIIQQTRKSRESNTQENES